MINKKRPEKDWPSVKDLKNSLRGFILDSQIEAPHELAVLLGCSNISEDVAEMEEEASDLRVIRVKYLSPFIIFFAKSLAEAIIESQRQDDEANEIPTEVWTNTKRLLEHTSTSAILGSITQMVDLGLLEIPKRRKND